MIDLTKAPVRLVQIGITLTWLAGIAGFVFALLHLAEDQIARGVITFFLGLAWFVVGFRCPADIQCAGFFHPSRTRSTG